jgi:hypothetical protein
MRAKDGKHVIGKERTIKHHEIKACGGGWMEGYLHTLSFILDECERIASRFDLFSRGERVAGTDLMNLRDDPDAWDKMPPNHARHRIQIALWSSP